MLDKINKQCYNLIVLFINTNAAVVESADTRDLKSRDSDIVTVQVCSAAPVKISMQFRIEIFFIKINIIILHIKKSALILVRLLKNKY